MDFDKHRGIRFWCSFVFRLLAWWCRAHSPACQILAVKQTFETRFGREDIGFGFQETQ